MRKEKYSTSLFIGETTGGRPLPVFWDPHTPVINNRPPGTLITGEPGSGKTFLALTLTAMSAILGKTTVVLDPKGDFLALDNIKDQIGHFALMNLARGKSGLLDPFYMTSDPNEQLSLAMEVIDIFLGGVSGTELSVLSPIVQDVRDAQNPSLAKVILALRGSEREGARALGSQLDLLSKMPYAKLCFAPGTGHRQALRIDSGLTVITLVGLELPPAGETNLTMQNRLASGIMYLLTDFLKRVMMDDDSQNPKTIIMDEAHAVLSNDAGARSVKSLALLGRSKYLSLILITQNNSHIDKLDIENTISTRFAFRSSRGEADAIIAAMELPRDENFQDIIINLGPGECLLKDYRERYSTVQISAWRKDWMDAFSSNPLERLAKAKSRS